VGLCSIYCLGRRPLEGETPTIDLAVGYSKANTSPVLKLFLSRLDELVVTSQNH
jgi:LysR family hca operon transcriptional activator